MDHGLCAVLVASCLSTVLSRQRKWVPLGGLLVGWLIATRPLTGLVIGCVMVWVLLRAGETFAKRARALVLLAPAALGVGALLWQQHAVTGEWLMSSQYRYYELSDHPLGCFRFGLGTAVGCRGEHGDFVANYLPHGYGPWQALGTTLRRLAQHLADAGNQELFAMVLLAAPWLGRNERRVRLLCSALALQVVSYAGFYFDGNYPGGGARMFADVLPLEHVLIAWVLTRVNWSHAAVPAMTLGFAFHTSLDHTSLARRDGGRPMYDEDLVRTNTEPNAMVFVSTDHGYNLAFDPSGQGRRIARTKGDALDHAAWLAAAKPPAYRFVFDPAAERAEPRLEPYAPATDLRFQAENQWPLPSGQVRGVRLGPGPTGGAGLWLGPGRATLSLWVPAPGRYQLTGAMAGPVTLEQGAALAAGEVLGPGLPTGTTLKADRSGDLQLVVRVDAEPGFVDWLELQPLGSAVGR